MANSSSYRVKVDLSNFYGDVRKLSYVFINEKIVSHVLHLHERIKDVFGISRPFYLTCNEGVYLPPNEDVRIIAEGETIMVCPGPVNPDSLTLWKETEVKCNGKPLQTIQVEKVLELKNQEATAVKNIVTLSDSDKDSAKIDGGKDPLDGSVMVAESEAGGPASPADDSDTDALQDPRNMSTDATPDLYEIPRKKRRRVRKRRSKKPAETPVSPKIAPKIPFVKPIIQGSILSPVSKPKHFKFNWDNEESRETRVESNGGSELNTLLSLEKCQFPLTFVGQKSRNPDGRVEETNLGSEKPKKCDEPLGRTNSGSNGSHQSPKTNGRSVLNGNSKEIDFSSVDPLQYPISHEEFHVGDVIAFRILKMGEDYSPTVSGYIIAETVLQHLEPSTYSFKIINGQDHLKGPEGKFSLMSDEEMETEEKIAEPEIHVMTREQLLELRLISAKSA